MHQPDYNCTATNEGFKREQQKATLREGGSDDFKLVGIFQNFNILPPEHIDKLDFEERVVIINQSTPFSVRAIPKP